MRPAGIVAVVGAAMLWGTTGTAATFAPAARPLAIGSAALGIGGLLQALLAVPDIRRAAPKLWVHRGVAAAGAVSVAIYPLAFYGSMYYAGVAVGTVVSLALAPIAAGVLELIVDRKPLAGSWMVAAVLGVIGSVLLGISHPDGHATDARSVPVGIALGLVAAATYATYSWAAHTLMGRGVARSAAMGSILGCGGLMLMPVLAATGAPLIATTQSFLVVGYLALIPMFAGYLLFGCGLARLSAGTATTITLIEPAVAAVLAVIVLGEHLPLTGWSGLATFAIVLLVLAVAPPHDAARRTPRTTAPPREPSLHVAELGHQA